MAQVVTHDTRVAPAGREQMFTPQEWAVLHFLEKIRARVLKPLIERWQTRLGQEDGDDTFWRNIAAGFLFPIEPLRTQIGDAAAQLLSALESRQEDRHQPRAVVARTLERHGHLLFNAYHYVLVRAFDDYHLVPLILGFRPHDPSHLEESQRLVQRQKLSFHINARYVDTYEQLLPCTAGITPYGLRLHVAGLEERVRYSPNFLGDLAILYKREDFLQGHLAAIACFLRDRASNDLEDALGAFVLTSTIPDAFDSETVRALTDVVDEDLKFGILRGLHSPPSLYERGIVTRIGAASSRGVPILETLASSMAAPLRRLLIAGVAKSVVIARANIELGPGERAVATAMNMESLLQIAKSAFPSAPLLTHRWVGYNHDSPAFRSVDFARLSTAASDAKQCFVARGIEDWDVDSIGALLNSDSEALHALVGALCPEATSFKEASSDWSVYRRRLDEASSLVIVGKRLPDDDVTRPLLAVCRAAIALPELPEGENGIFASAQRLCVQQAVSPNEKIESWFAVRDGADHRRDRDQTRDDLVVRLVRQVCHLLTDDSFRAVIVVREGSLFLPDIPESCPPILQEALSSSAVYWMLERIAQICANDFYVPLDAFGETDAAVPYVFESDSKLAVTVDTRTLTSAEKTALTFFGVPVHHEDGAEWSGVRDAYRHYVLGTLQNAADDGAIQRAFKPWATRLTVARVDVAATPDVILQTITTISNDGVSHVTPIPWRRINNCSLDLFCTNATSILRGWLTSVPPDTPAFRLQDGGASVWTFPEQGYAAVHGDDWLAANDNLRKAQRALVEEEERSKDELYVAVSHELRSPLANLRLDLKTVDAILSDSRARQILRRAASSLRSASRFVDNALTRARLVVGELSFDEVDLATVVNEVAEEMRPDADRQHIDIQTHAGSNIRCHCDDFSVRVALRNLINNAIRNSPDGASVDIELQAEEASVRLSVSDRGKGFTEQALEEFRQFGQPMQRSQGARALGIGLFLVQRIVVQHGGTVTLRNRTPHGAVVTLEIPRGRGRRTILAEVKLSDGDETALDLDR